MPHNEIRVYGTDWCADTRRVLQLLDRLGVTYRYINLDNDERAAQRVKQWNQGKEVKPTLELIAGTSTEVLSNPTDDELEQILRDMKLIGVDLKKEGLPLDDDSALKEAS